ncbi:MAG TPA: flavin reductase family protein [Ktedonobacterales bacterium]|nr:flavin reductase family protein [Ktedonobacterales bacterium]
MDETAKKEALRLFTYGLYAITAGTHDDWSAFTANWLTQVSFDPPLVALSVENDSHSLPIIQRTRRFVVNVFAADQRELAGALGKPYRRHPEKAAGLAVEMTPSGCPALTEALAWVQCEVENEMPAGDSTLMLARVIEARVLREGEPLTMRAAGFKHAG